MKYVRYILFGMFGLAMGTMLILGFTGMAIGMWVALHWHLRIDNWGFWAVMGGFIVQAVSLVSFLTICESQPKLSKLV